MIRSYQFLFDPDRNAVHFHALSQKIMIGDFTKVYCPQCSVKNTRDISKKTQLWFRIHCVSSEISAEGKKHDVFFALDRDRRHISICCIIPQTTECNFPQKPPMSYWKNKLLTCPFRKLLDTRFSRSSVT